MYNLFDAEMRRIRDTPEGVEEMLLLYAHFIKKDIKSVHDNLAEQWVKCFSRFSAESIAGHIDQFTCSPFYKNSVVGMVAILILADAVARGRAEFAQYVLAIDYITFESDPSGFYMRHYQEAIVSAVKYGVANDEPRNVLRALMTHDSRHIFDNIFDLYLGCNPSEEFERKLADCIRETEDPEHYDVLGTMVAKDHPLIVHLGGKL